jgi:PAS domain S-box-containing protein
MDSRGTGALAGYSQPWSPWAAIQSRPARLVLGFCAFQLAYTCAYYFGMSFDPIVAAPFWFPDAVLLCGLLSTRRKWWWLLLVAILPVRLLVAVPPNLQLWFLASVYVNDCAKGVLAAVLLQRYLADPIRLRSMRDLGVYLLIAVLLVPALSAVGGAATRAGVGKPFAPSFEQWLLGDALASLVVAPILFYWVVRPPNPKTFSQPRIIEALVLAAGVLLSLKYAFAPAPDPRDIAETRYYAPLPFMVWAAIRFRMFGATAVAAALSAFTIEAALSGTGSFAGIDSTQMSSQLQHFLLLRIAPLYLAAVLIEQWHQVSSSLRDSEQRFRNIANSVPVMMWTSGTDGGADFINRSWLEFTGRSLEESLGNGWAESVHPDDRQRSYDTYMRAFGDRQPLEMELRVRRRDGEYRWTLSLGQPRYGADGEFLGYAGSAIDLTERRQQEAALRRSEARYRDVVESQANFVCRLLADGTLTFVNSAFCRFLGRERVGLLGEDFVGLLPAAARASARGAIERALGESAQSAWECEVARADGTRGWQSWVCHALEAAPDEAREIQVIGYDVTDRKRAEESGRQLAQATRFAAVGELTAMVAHEINQPLCAILSNAEAAEIMLRGDQPPLDELREIVADIRNDDLRADAAIRGIRSLLRRRDYEPRPVDLVATVNHVFKLSAGDALYRRVPIRQELAPDLPWVTGDRSSIEQVLVILIVNGMDAMKDTPEAERDLMVGARREGEFVQVTVRDRGHGISPANMSQLFDSFFTTKVDGMGMGLSIARSMIFMHGGRIWAENAAEGGAMFHFTLKVATRPASA